MREEKFYEELSPYVERVKQGDQDTFEYLYQATYDMTKWFVLNFCKDKNEAEDIIQEIYLDFKSADKTKGRSDHEWLLADENERNCGSHGL